MSPPPLPGSTIPKTPTGSAAAKKANCPASGGPPAFELVWAFGNTMAAAATAATAAPIARLAPGRSRRWLNSLTSNELRSGAHLSAVTAALGAVRAPCLTGGLRASPVEGSCTGPNLRATASVTVPRRSDEVAAHAITGPSTIMDMRVRCRQEAGCRLGRLAQCALAAVRARSSAWPRLKPIRSYDRGVLSERHLVRRGCPGSSARPVAHNRVSQGSAPPGASGNRRASTREQRAEGGVQASAKPSARSCMCTSVSCTPSAAKPFGVRHPGGVVGADPGRRGTHHDDQQRAARLQHLHQAGRTRITVREEEFRGSVRPLLAQREGTWVSSGGLCGPGCTA